MQLTQQQIQEQAEKYANEYHDAFIEGAKWMQEQEKWISVNDRLPEDNTMVLVWQKNITDKESSRVQKANYLSAGVFTIYPAVHTTIYKNTKGYRNYDLEGDLCKLTHWQPLPQPPKQD